MTALNLRNLLSLTVLAFVIALVAAPGAFAGQGFDSSGDQLGLVPGNQSAGDQYVETLPTTSGPRAPGKGKHRNKLHRGISRKLQAIGGKDAATLEALATSPELGAPSRVTSAAGGGKGSRKGSSRSDKRNGKSTPAVPSAAINAADGGDAGLGRLVLAILAITALALGAVGYQRHRNTGSTD